jgi:hypothetical protein
MLAYAKRLLTAGSKGPSQVWLGAAIRMLAYAYVYVCWHIYAMRMLTSGSKGPSQVWLGAWYTYAGVCYTYADVHSYAMRMLRAVGRAWLRAWVRVSRPGLLPFSSGICVCYAYAMRMLEREFAICTMRMLCVCYAYAMRMLCVYIYAMRMLCVCYAYSMRMLCVCYTYAMRMLCVCYACEFLDPASCLSSARFACVYSLSLSLSLSRILTYSLTPSSLSLSLTHTHTHTQTHTARWLGGSGGSSRKIVWLFGTMGGLQTRACRKNNVKRPTWASLEIFTPKPRVWASLEIVRNCYPKADLSVPRNSMCTVVVIKQSCKQAITWSCAWGRRTLFIYLF